MSEQHGQKGHLKFENIGGEIYAPKLYDETGTLKPEFAPLRKPLGLEDHQSVSLELDANRSAISANDSPTKCSCSVGY